MPLEGGCQNRVSWEVQGLLKGKGGVTDLWLIHLGEESVETH